MIRTHDSVLATEDIGPLSYAVTKTDKFQTYISSCAFCPNVCRAFSISNPNFLRPPENFV